MIYLIVFFVSFFFRYMVVRSAPIDFDTYGHLYFAKELKLQKVNPFGNIKLNVVGNDGFSHPFLLHWIISFFPIDKVLKHQKFINPVLDSLFTVMIFFVSKHIGFSQSEAFLVTAIYVFTPMWFSRLAMGPRINSFTPRLFSEILSNSFFMVTILPLGLDYWTVIIVGAILSSISLSSTKFGVQVLIFLTPVISIFSQSTTPMFALVCGIVLSAVASKGKILNSFKEQLAHLSNYYIKNLNGETIVSNRNSFNKMLNSLNEYKRIDRKLMILFNRMLSNNSYTGIMLKMPSLLIVLFLYFFSMIDKDILIPGHHIMPVVGASIVFLIVNIPLFLFLGEAERYLNHVAYFIIISFVFLSFKTNMLWISYCLIGYGTIYWFFESFLFDKIRPNNLDLHKISDNVVSFLQNLKKPSVILSYPYHVIGTWRLMIETNHRVIYSDLDRKQGRRTSNNWYDSDYPFINLNVIDRMHAELGVNVLVMENKYLIKKKKGWLPSALWTKVEIGAPFYAVYEINE